MLEQQLRRARSDKRACAGPISHARAPPMLSLLLLLLLLLSLPLPLLLLPLPLLLLWFACAAWMRHSAVRLACRLARLIATEPPR